MFDLSALVRYITRFTEESFALLIALIFIYEAFKKLFHILDEYPLGSFDYIRDYNGSCWCNEPNATGKDIFYQVFCLDHVLGVLFAQAIECVVAILTK